MRLPNKLPDVVWIETFDFVKQLAEGDEIVSCSAVKKRGNIELGEATLLGTKVTVKLSGGTLGETAEFWVLAPTRAGETLGEAITVRIAGSEL